MQLIIYYTHKNLNFHANLIIYLKLFQLNFIFLIFFIVLFHKKIKIFVLFKNEII